ncbi:MAG: Gfo/Idh/MocA family oxidoreductase [Hyphomicrobiaceae bacterium]
MSNHFGLIGIGGYVAPRHLRAIKDVGGELKVALDPSDSVGVMDSYFPKTDFFTEFERFDRHVDRMRREGHQLDYISICSPNYLHDAHARFALRCGCEAICEKPLVLNPHNIDGLADIEQQTGKQIHTILQLRLHPSILALKEKIDAAPADTRHDVDLTYVTSRGRWYYVSWKGDDNKSGGIACNIGVHFFDMLGFVFGKTKRSVVHHRAIDCVAGVLELEKANVRWFLSINSRDLPESVVGKQTTYRSITIDDEELEFSGGFTDLHTASYQEILAGRGFPLSEVRPSIELVSQVRVADIVTDDDPTHPFVEKVRKDVNRYDGRWPL